MRNFRKLEVWHEGISFCKEIYTLTASFPYEEKFGLIKQLTRAAVSVPSNIAEGCSRKSKEEFARFLEIALGSAFEIETQLEISKELKLFNPNENNNLFEKLGSLQKRLNALRTSILK